MSTLNVQSVVLGLLTYHMPGTFMFNVIPSYRHRLSNNLCIVVIPCYCSMEEVGFPILIAPVSCDASLDPDR